MTEPAAPTLENKRKKRQDNSNRLEDQENRTLSVAIIGSLCALTAISIALVNVFDEVALFGFPLGYFLMVNGILLIAVTAVFWGVLRQEALQHQNSLNEED